MAAFSHKVFFTETRGTGTYTRVQIDIDGDKEPLIINLDSGVSARAPGLCKKYFM